MVLHNERLADPLDSITQALAEVTGKRKKAIEDHQEIARREFFGGLYTNPTYEWPLPEDLVVQVALPSWNVLRCLQDGAKRYKRGPDVLRGVSPSSEYAPIIFEHEDGAFDNSPISPQGMWQAGRYSLRKSVGVQKSRTMRTRPIFQEWMLELEVEVDPTVLDIHTIRHFWKDSGRYCGLGEMRPVFGKFDGTLEILAIDEEDVAVLEGEPELPKAKTNGRAKKEKATA